MAVNPLPGGLGIGSQVQTARPTAMQAVPVAVQPANVMGALAGGFSLGQKILDEPVRQKMLEQQQKLKGMQLAAQERMMPIKEQAAQLSLQQQQQEISDSRKREVLGFAAQLRNVKDPEQKRALLEQRNAQLVQSGIDNSDTQEALRLLNEDPTGAALDSATDALLEAGYQQQLLARPAVQGGKGTTAKLQEFATWQAMPEGPEKTALGQMIGAVPKPRDAKTSTVATPTGVNVIDNQTGNVIRRVVDPDKKAEFDAKQKERKQALEERKRQAAQRAKEAQIAEVDMETSRRQTAQTSARAFEIARELMQPGVIDAVTGTWDTWTPTLLPSSQDVINKGNELKDLLTLDNLGLMKGVLTDRDVKILQMAGSGLNVDEDGFIGSEEGVRRQIRRITEMLDDKLFQAAERGAITWDEYAEMVGLEVE